MTQNSEVGLLSSHDGRTASIPLTAVRVRAKVEGSVSRVRIEQDYENRESGPIEAVYVFPLEERSAVCGFAVTIGDRRLPGVVLARDEAFDRYDDAMAEGHGAFLLDQERPNIFTASVGNVMPGQRVTIELSYLTELDRIEDSVRLLIPTTVSPRYVPHSRRDFPGMVDGERVNPPVSLAGTPYRLDLEVEADLFSPIRSVESPSHKVKTVLDGTRARITLAGDEGALDRDFVLTLKSTSPHEPTSWLGRDEHGDRFVAVSFAPKLGTDRKPVELVFVVDCSGSMYGSSIEEARKTLLLCLQSLSPGDRFNVVRFGSTHEALFPRALPYDDATLARGKELAARMDADLGGTEIERPLREVLESATEAGLPRRIVLITDGQVSNEADVIDLARRHRGTARIFSFGLGAGVSEHLVRGVARASGGAAEFVHPGEDVEEKVMRHFDRFTLPAATEIRLDFEGIEVADVTPADIPALAPGEEILFTARVTAGTEGRAVLSASHPEGDVRFEASIAETPPDAAAGRILPTLWARRRVRELEESAPRGSRQADRAKERAKERTESELVRLGTRYGLMSSATSYVVIEERTETERATTRAELRRIPVALTRGWGGGGIGGMAPPMGAMASMSMPSSPAPRAMSLGASAEMLDDLCCDAAPAEPAARAKAEPAPGPFGLLLLQSADGSWDLTEEFARQADLDLGALREAAADLGGADADGVVATLVALAILTEETPRASWRPVIRKGEAWRDRALDGRDEPGEGWQGYAKEVLRRAAKRA